ncbi:MULTISPECIES: hypothetical protein [unclassified Janthinobacterium]|uniref:hypothetical protein n=1 Tax=unclassified Janthinobacterium TaxID=2610881 RepID=UPI001618BB36|nr:MULTISPECIES: hypothetical protein [unclassified Janthinobacterium]MBB5607227.1 hypothetical protein [Janthinobacterium sp. S3T4]MBB5612952.1 hypothetical protein [Janthinobacterium sp. S3M3]
MKDFGLAPKRPPLHSSPTLKAEIMWGCERGGSTHFPRDIDTIGARKRAPAPQPLYAFRYAVMNAVKRIWVMDKYFLAPEEKRKPDERIITVLDWLHAKLVASDIRILTAQHDEITAEFLQLFKDKENYINTMQARRDTRCLIEINTCLTRGPIDVHDRFAIVDDELWHFGATVGGFHASVSAASRGWSAEDVGAVNFFELVWEKCKETR